MIIHSILLGAQWWSQRGLGNWRKGLIRLSLNNCNSHNLSFCDPEQGILFSLSHSLHFSYDISYVNRHYKTIILAQHQLDTTCRTLGQ